MRMYDDLSGMYRLITPRAEYEEEAGRYASLFRGSLGNGRLSLLELGTGAGHNASWLTGFDLTLTDISPKMLALAQALNPDATCVLGDMRTLRLGRTFDAVLAHDAVCYMRTEADLRAAMQTAHAHLNPGGVALFVPDYVAETFEADTECGGADGDQEAVRYLEWVWQRPGQTDSYMVDYVICRRSEDGQLETHHDRHEEGLFSIEQWVSWLDAAGFDAAHVEAVDEVGQIFRGIRR